MGWVSYLEDSIERLNDRIHLVEEILEENDQSNEQKRIVAISALKEAKAVLKEATAHLDLATSPELDAAYEIAQLKKQIEKLKGQLQGANHKARESEKEAANNYAVLQDANRDIKQLKKEKRKLEKDFEKVAGNDLASALEAFSSPGMIKKHKPNA